jgi:hypothetical protein
MAAPLPVLAHSYAYVTRAALGRVVPVTDATTLVDGEQPYSW